MEAKFEEETEAVQQEVGCKQLDLTSKIKRAEENLAQMTQQQTDMMEQTKSEVRGIRMQESVTVVLASVTSLACVYVVYLLMLL